jgi:hypothetical protein
MIVAVRTNIDRTMELVVRSRVYLLCGCSVTVLSMSPPANQRSRLVGEVYPAKHAPPDWPQDAAIRDRLEKLYTEWDLDVRWLRGERSHKVVIAPSVPLRKQRRSCVKSRQVK